MKIDELVSNYYRYLKAKARLYADPKCSLNANKAHRKEFFKQFTIKQIIDDCKILDCFIDIASNVSNISLIFIQNIIIIGCKNW